MKNQATQYLALDVHQAIIVATLRSADGSVRMRATVPTETRAVERRDHTFDVRPSHYHSGHAPPLSTHSRIFCVKSA